MVLFNATLNQMLLMFLFLFIGYMLKKLNKLPDNAHIVLSKVENYIFIPSLTLYTFMTNCTVENLAAKWVYIVFCIGIVLAGMVIGRFLAPLFAKEASVQNVYKYNFVIANFGFVGNVLVEALFGSAALFDYMLFTLPLQVFIYTVGCVWLIPSVKKFSFKSLLNPMFGSVLVGALIGLTGIKLPGFVETAVSSAKSCMSPVAMIISGFVVGSYGLKSLLVKKHVYVMTILRLIVIPIAYYYVLKLCGAPSDILFLTLAAFAMPLGLNPIIIPAAYGGDTTEAASMVLISHIVALITIPIVFAIFL